MAVVSSRALFLLSVCIFSVPTQEIMMSNKFIIIDNRYLVTMMISLLTQLMLSSLYVPLVTNSTAHSRSKTWQTNSPKKQVV